MRSLPLLAACTVALLTVTNLHAASEGELVSQAQGAYSRGDLGAAETLFKQVLRENSKNATAVGFLRRIAADKLKGPAGNSKEKQYAALILPRVEFQEASLSTALDALKQKVEAVSQGQTSISFVLPKDDALKNTPVTIALRDVPVTEVLRYIGELAGVEFVYDRYAVVVRAKGSGAGAAATTATQ